MDMRAEGNRHDLLLSILGKYWLLLLTIIIIIVFAGLEQKFMTIKNMFAIVNSAAITAIAGIGITFIMATGELDFSAGSQLAAASVIMGFTLSWPWFNSYVLAIIITVAFMIVFGLFNAVLHVKMGIPAFIATFGTSYLLLGVMKVITGNKTYYNFSGWPDCFTFLGQGYVFGIPVMLIVLVIVSAIAFIFTEKTKWGKFLYAIGSNPTACDYIGINSRAQKTRGFILCSIFCALAGILQGSMTNMASISIGDSTMMKAITVIMVGATFWKNGVFNIPGTLLASLLLQILDNGLTMVGAEAYARDGVQGLILLLAIVLVMVFKRRSAHV